MQETERKYEVPSSCDTSWLPPVDRVEGVTSVADRSLEELDAVYYDTDDLRLSGSSAVLRRRTGGFDAGWHLNLPLPGDSREEVQAALTDAVPDALRDLALSRTRGAELTPVVRIRSSREVRELVHVEGGVLAELSIDAVRAQSLRAQGRSAAWREEKLREHGIAHAQWSSKPARVLDEMAPVPAGEHPRLRTGADPRPHRPRPGRATRPTRLGAPDAGRLPSPAQLFALVPIRSGPRGHRRDPRGSEVAGRRAVRRTRSGSADEASHPGRQSPTQRARPGPRLGTATGVERRSRLRVPPAQSRRLGSRRYLALLASLAALGQQPPLRAMAGKAADKVMAKAVLKEFDRLAQRMAPALDLPPGSGLSGAVWSAVAGG